MWTGQLWHSRWKSRISPPMLIVTEQRHTSLVLILPHKTGITIWIFYPEGNRTDASNWSQEVEETDALHRNTMWILTKLSPGKNLIICKWVLKVKHNADGNMELHIARFAAEGFSQEFGQNFDEAFALVMKHNTSRLFLGPAESKKMQVKHLDINTAFLQREIRKSCTWSCQKVL